METLETVVSSEPAIQFSVEAAEELREWKDGLCDCCNDGKNCEFVLSEKFIRLLGGYLLRCSRSIIAYETVR